MHPMLALVERLTRKEYAVSVPASTSLDTLIVTWPGAEIASVGFDPQMRCFRVEYWARSSKVIRHKCGLEGAETLFDCFVLRLSLTCVGEQPNRTL